MNRHAHSVQIVQLFLHTEAKIKYWNHSSVYIRSQRRVVCGLKWHLHLRQQHQRENPLHMCLAFVQYMCLLSLALRSLPPPHRHCTERQTTGQLTLGERDDFTCGLSCWTTKVPLCVALVNVRLPSRTASCAIYRAAQCKYLQSAHRH